MSLANSIMWMLVKSFGAALGLVLACTLIIYATQQGLINGATAGLIGAALGAGLAVVGAAYLSGLEREREARQVTQYISNNLDNLRGAVGRAERAIAPFLPLLEELDTGSLEFRTVRDSAIWACNDLLSAIHLHEKRMTVVEAHIYRLRLPQIDALQLSEEMISDTAWLKEVAELIDVDAPSPGALLRLRARFGRFEMMSRDLESARRMLLAGSD